MNYDSSGLMAQIQALIAAPNTTRTRTNNKHPYFKRPGRGHNHDTCDACREAGDLLCCDTCSASFHLLCVNPPLSYDQIPSGDWRCHRCQISMAETPEEPLVKKPQVNSRKPKKRSAALSSATGPSSKKPALQDAEDESSKGSYEGKGVLSRFFSEATAQAKKLNPEQFSLPKYLQEFGAAQFPGAARPSSKKTSNKANKQVVELENGMIPSPVVICFVCEISCRKGPMIKCDGCLAYFHFECVNPPLTGIPQGRWLCHLHPEPVLEAKKLKTLSFTERLRLYDYAKKPVDPVQVALRFVTKAKRAQRMYFYRKAPIKGKDYTHVPGSIVRCYTEEETETDLPSWPENEEVALKSAASFYVKTKNSEVRETDMSDDLNPLELLAQIASKELDDRSTTRENAGKPETIPQDRSDIRRPSYDKTFEGIKKEKLSAQDESLLEGLDLDAILQLAAQKMRELRCNETMETANGFGERSDGRHNVNGDSGDSWKHMEADTQLAAQMLKTNPSALKSGVTQVEIPVPYIKLLILNTKKEVVFKEGQIMVGRGTADLNLVDYFPCQGVTDEHCCIYYDYVRSSWELINYSPNGTIVNKVPYGCNPRRKEPTKMAQELQVLKTSKDTSRNPTLFFNGKEKISSNFCACYSSPVHTDTKDGSAYLHVGSRVQIGCIRIVVVDTGTESKWIPRDKLVYNPIPKLPIYKKETKSLDGSRKNSNSSISGSETETADNDEFSDNDAVVNGSSDVAKPVKFKRPDVSPPQRLRGRGRGRGRGGITGSRRKSGNDENQPKEVGHKTGRGRRKKFDGEPRGAPKSNSSPRSFAERSPRPDVLVNHVDARADSTPSKSTGSKPVAIQQVSVPTGDHDYVSSSSAHTFSTNNREMDSILT